MIQSIRARSQRKSASHFFDLPNGWRRALGWSAVSLAFSSFAGSAFGENHWTNPALGNWFIAGNWTGGVPVGGDDVFIRQGTVLVSSPGAVSDSIHMGESAGTGALIISNGGTYVQSGAISYIGIDTGSNSSVTVTGAGSFWGARGVLLGGTAALDGGSGALRVENGGRVESFDARLANGMTSIGSATVTGPGSLWTIQGQLTAGHRASGSLNISNGGTVEVTNGWSSIGVDNGSSGSVTVTGANSRWVNNGTVFVGGRGTAAVGGNGAGTLQVSNGGLVQARHLQVFDTGSAQVNNGSSTVSGLTVSGGTIPDAVLSPLGALTIGNTASGRMVVQNGGTVSNSVGTIAGNSGTIGSVLVQGAGSTWTNTDQLSVGHNGTGTLEVLSGGTLRSFRGFAGAGLFSTGIITVSDPGSTWTASGSLFIGNSGSGLLKVLNGGVVSTAGNSHLGITVGASGDVEVTGAGSTWNTAVLLNIGGDSAVARGVGSVRIADGGIVNVGSATNLYHTGRLDLVNATTFTGELNTFGGLIRTSGNTTLANAVHLNAGGVSVETNNESGNAVFSGNIDGVGGLTKSTVIGITGNGKLTLTGANTYAGATTVNAGTLVVDGSIISATTVNSGATLGGSGTVGTIDIKSGATLSPGNSPGLLTAADAILQGGSNYGLELRSDGTGAAGVDWDSLAVNGTLDISSLTAGSPLTVRLRTLDGANNGNPLDVWNPAVSHTWPSIVSTTAGLAGAFDNSLFQVDATDFQSPIRGAFSVVQNGANLDLQYDATIVPDTVLVTNLAEPLRSATPIGNNPNPANPPEPSTAWYWGAQQFLSDNKPYTLTSIEAMVGDGSISPPPVVVAELHADSTGSIGSLIATLTAPDVSGSPTALTFLPNEAVTLEANTAYWLVLGSEAPGDGTYAWQYADTAMFAGPGSLGNFADSADSGVNWTYGDASYPYFIQVNVTAVAPPPPPPTDFDGDGDVDGEDLLPWTANFGATDANAMQGDADGDLDVDGTDYLAWQQQLGGAAVALVSATTVPEPMTAVLLLTNSIAVTTLARRSRNLSTLSRRAAWFGVMGAMLLGTATQRPAHAITIDMEYTDEGDDPPHDENPSWDPSGTILKAHFERARAIWQALLPGDGDYEFDFHWDDDIDGLGLASDFGAIDVYIEINPDYNWFADPTPGDDVEFTPTQTLFNGLSGPDQSTYFPGTPPPGTLEVGYRGAGLAIHPITGLPTTSDSGILSDNASNSYDLLSTVVHEMGHILGISGVEPGEYNIYPHHVGGLEDVLVLEDDDSGHLAGEGAVPFLMCESCGALGVRRFPTATDVLVIAEDQGIANVHLQRVGSISSGVWGDQSKWISFDVPDLTQDVYIRHGGVTTLNADAQTKSLLIDSGSSVDVQNYQLSVNGPLSHSGTTVSVGAGGTIEADSISGNGALTTTVGSTVRFNSFTAGASAAVSFNGSVAIGYNKNSGGSGTFVSTFDPSTFANWNIAQKLAVGDKNTNTTLVIDGGTTFRSATGQIGADAGGSGRGIVNIDGAGSSWTITGALDARNGSLNITNQGSLTVGGDVDIRGALAAASQVAVASGGMLAVSGDIVVGPFGMATFGDNTVAGFNRIRNEGAAVLNGSTGLTTFTGSSSAANGVFVNTGGAFQSGKGGATRFTDNSSAGDGTFINHGGTTIWAEGGQTTFSGASTAASATITNDGPTGLYGFVGKTIFNDAASAGSATITNLPSSGAATTTDFYGTSNAGGTPTALGVTIINQSGTYPTVPGITTFHDSSSAGRGTFINDSGLTGHGGGQFIFEDSSTADRGTFTNGGLMSHGHVTFNDNSTAGQATIIVQGPGDSRLMFFDDSDAGAANIDVGPLAFGPVNTSNLVQFYGRSTAEGSMITVRGDGGHLSFAGNYNMNGNATTTAGDATILAVGSTRTSYVPGTIGGQVQFNSWSTAGNATITAQGAVSAGATAGAGGLIVFLNGGQAGNATLIANGGATADIGGGIRFQSSGAGDSARLIVNAGAYADFSLNASHGGTEVGSIEGAGRFFLGGSLLTVGNRNTSTVVSGNITDAGGYAAGAGGMLTKVGTGTLILSGANAYTGLTTVDEGTLVINGSIAGHAVVKSGGTLKGSGSMGTPTVELGGVFAPGTSPGTVTVAGLNLMSGSTLEYELGTAARDRIVVTNNGNVTLGGVLNLSLLDGFNPPLGQSFSLFEGAVGSITGEFSAVNAPTFNGHMLNVLYGANQVTLRVGEASSFLAADFNEDGSVDGADLSRWQGNFGAGALHMQGDADGDLDVDGGDFLVWQRQLGRASGVPAAGQVPEPASFALFSMTCCGLALLRPGAAN